MLLNLYSMQWGKATSEQWLAAFFLSFFQSLCLVDPFKVIAVSFLLSIVFNIGGSKGDDKIVLNLEDVYQVSFSVHLNV